MNRDPVGTAKPPRVSVVIPTWDGLTLLRKALESLRAQTCSDFETIVVDNGSADGTVNALEQCWPEVRIVRLGENRGFAAAVNAGIGKARGDVIVLMNNDIEAEAGWLGALVDALDREPLAGACASRMLKFDDRGVIDSAGDQLGLFAWAIGHGDADGPAYGQPRDVFSACAGAAAYRRSALDEVGLFDERFFAYLEDVDLGARMQLAGWRCLYVPDAVVYHHGSATAKRLPELKLRLLMRNSLFLFFQYMPVSTIALWGPAMLVWPFWRTARERRSPYLAVAALREVIGDLRGIARRRADVRRIRRISARQFRGRLTGRLSRIGNRSANGPASDVGSGA